MIIKLEAKLLLCNVVYIVDPGKVISEALTLLLATYDTQVRVFDDNQSFIKACSIAGKVNCCLMIEAQLSADSELPTLRELRELGLIMPVIILTDKLTPRIRARALKLGVTDIMELPVMSEFLIRRLRQLMPSIERLDHNNPSSFELHDGTQIVIRVMRPDDADIEDTFVHRLSPESSRMRFLSMLKQLSPSLLDKFTHNEFPETYVVIATTIENDLERQIGVARYMSTEVEGVAEFAIVVADDFQGAGIASKLLSGVVTAASIAGVNRLEGLVLKENRAMLNLALELGFQIQAEPNDLTLLRVHKNLVIRSDD
jgi:FixJ family two-component response regulator/GNAT superfamily N-acetyltransferase